MAHPDKKKYVLQTDRAAYTQKKYTVKRTKTQNSPPGNFTKGTIGGDIPKGQGDTKKSGTLLKKIFKENSDKKEASEQTQHKKAAYIQDNIQNDAAASYAEQYSDTALEESVSPKEEQDLSTGKTEEKPIHNAKSDSIVPNKNDISSDKAEQMKRAAFIKAKLQKNIAAAQMKSTYYEQNEEACDRVHSASKSKDNTPSYVASKMEGVTNENAASTERRYLGNSESISENKHKNSLDNAEVKKAYKTKILGEQLNRRRAAADMYSQAKTNAALISAEKAKAAAMKNAEADANVRDNVIPGVEKAAEYMSAAKDGDTAKILSKSAKDILRKHLSDGTNQFLDKAGIVSGAVKESDSVGGAVANVGVSLAANAIKQSVSSALKKPLTDKKIEERLEKKFHYIDRKTDKQMSRIQAEKREAMNGNISKSLEKKLDKIERNQERYKEKLAKQQQELQRRQQKNIYIKHNRKNPVFVGGREKGGTLRKLVGKKSSLLLMGGVAPIIIIIVVIVLFLAVIGSVFAPIGWLKGFHHSDDALNDSEEHEVMCVEYMKFKKLVTDKIREINTEITLACEKEMQFYESSNGSVSVTASPFIVATEKFWEYDDDDRKHITGAYIPYKGSHPSEWSRSAYETIEYTDVNGNERIIPLKLAIDDFDFAEFCVNFQVWSIKSKYPDDDVQNHSGEIFTLKVGKMTEFFNRTIVWNKGMYPLYTYARDITADDYKGDDEAAENAVIDTFRDVGYHALTLNCRCMNYHYDNCKGHQVKFYNLNVVPFEDILEEDGLELSENDRKFIEELTKSMQILDSEIVPEVMATYTGTYFDEPEETEESEESETTVSSADTEPTETGG